ncbi:bile acid:sodium symporter family protein, partial [Singulisphaera rosea]
ARGNVAAAVFNATLSSLLGVFLTPLWIGVMVQEGGEGSLPMGQVILDLVTWLLLPLVVGQLARPWLGAWVSRHKKIIHIVDRSTILLLVYTSFCESVVTGVWTGQGLDAVAETFVGTTLLFFVVLFATNLVCNGLGFTTEDRIAAVFCGSKKTLASGAPMAQLIFGHHAGLSLILLPIMIYHPLQLVICGVLAGRWAKRA